MSSTVIQRAARVVPDQWRDWGLQGDNESRVWYAAREVKSVVCVPSWEVPIACRRW